MDVDLRLPSIEVEVVAFAAVGLHELVRGAEVVVVESDDEVAELRVVDHVAHVSFGKGTLWQADDGVPEME
jgi:hypothetical protein